MRPALVLCVVFCMLAVAGAARADVPEVMSYQGVLRDDAGNVVPDSDYVLTFAVYDVDSGGTPLWSEDQTATVSGGIFNATLGTVTPLSLDFDVQYWLGIAVEHGSELTPRVRLTTSPYAFRAAEAEDLVGGVPADDDWEFSGNDIYRLSGEVGIGISSPTARLHVEGGTVTAGRFESSGPASFMTLEVENTVGTAAIFEAGSPPASYPGVPAALYGSAGGSAMGGLFVARDSGIGLKTFSEGTGNALSSTASGSGYSGWFEGGQGVRVVGECNIEEFRMQPGAGTGRVLTSDGLGRGTWVNPASVPDADWTISGSDMYSAVADNVGIGTPTPASKLHVASGTETAATLESSGTQFDVTLYVSNTAGTASTFEVGSPPSGFPVTPTAVHGSAGGDANAALFTAWGNGFGIRTYAENAGYALFANSTGTGDAVYAEASGSGYSGRFTGGAGVRIYDGCTVDGFQLTDSPVNGYVLVSDATGTGTWQPPAAVSDGDWTIAGIDMYSGVAGDVGIGTSSPAAKLEINSSASVEGLTLAHSGTPGRAVNLERTSVPTNGNDILQIKVPTGSPDGAQFIECERGASPMFQVTTDGSVVASGGGTFDDNVDVTGVLTVDNDGERAGEFTSDYVHYLTHVVHAEVTGTGTSDAIGVYGTSTPSGNYGLGGFFQGGYCGVSGYSTGDDGGHRGVSGLATGSNSYNTGVHAHAQGGIVSYGIYAEGAGATSANYAGYFLGHVHIVGTLSKSAGSFKIDHPLDPANKYLSHSFVESPDMMNVYNGNVMLDGSGEAWVELPEWFEVLNRDFRYQLTALDAPAPNLHVAERISGDSFKVAGGEPGMEVSWQVTGVRQDKYAEAHPIVVEEEKLPFEAGKYLHPELYGLPETARVGYIEERDVVVEASERAPKSERAWDPTDGE